MPQFCRLRDFLENYMLGGYMREVGRVGGGGAVDSAEGGVIL